MTSDLTVDSLGIKIAIDELHQCGVDPLPLLLRAGLDLSTTYGAGVRAPYDGQGKLFELAADATGDEFFGVLIAERSDPFELGPLSYVSLTSATFGDALANFRRYLRLVANVDALEISSDDGVVSVVAVPQDGATRPNRQMVDCAKFYFVKFCERLTGGRISPRELRFSYDFAGDPSEHIARFGCPVSFGHDVSQTMFDEADMCLELKTADTRLHKVLSTHCDALLSEIDRDAPQFHKDVQAAITALLPMQQAKAGPIAQELGLSERTLHRKLAEIGTKFGKVRDNVRRDLAYKYLLESDERISQIAYILDYSSQSAFNSAFRRLTGKTPGEVRRTLTKP